MTSLKFKKAAMFGLDARIALAIFGALSVISGAALYSAIGKSNATAVIADMREVGKAWESYYLDTGSTLPVRSATVSDWKHYSYNLSGLVQSNSVSGWNGPYISHPLSTVPEYLDYERFTNSSILMEVLTDKDWSATTWENEVCNDASDTCYVWVGFNGLNNATLISNMDEIVDGGDGAGSGDLRWVPSNLLTRVHLKIAPIKNPN
tara:strand:+ start:680 stop:1297 length:618 start_codon:yes stop_codon:yes gene_type:complete